MSASVSAMLSILVAIIGLAFLIVVHEWGHFIVARLCGMRVERFSVGFGKPLVSFKRGGTIFQIAPIPLGGFVQITGLNPHEEFDPKDPYVYPNRPRWMRLAVLVAGPAANYLTAMVLALGILIGYGKLTASNDIVAVMPRSPAQAAGLKAGDKLLEANGQQLSSSLTIRTAVNQAKGAPVTIKLRRDGQILTVVVSPRADASGRTFLIGVQPGSTYAPIPLGEAIRQAAVLPAVRSAEMLRDMRDMITGRGAADVTGPVGIARSMARAAEQGVVEFLSLMIMLSIYLGLFNLLPLPGLDGGRVLFLGINTLPIRQVSAKTEAAFHAVGILLMLGVFVLVTFKDIKELLVRFTG
jgi:regulator of sigma E protease